jgi:hypothetical protein
MTSSMRSWLACACMLCLSASTAAAQAVLKREPPERGLSTGQSVLVDDGSCPAGQIKKVVAGTEGKRVRRQRSCVARFDAGSPDRFGSTGGGY